jgi:N-acetylglucosamine kinase-like BadF-type ATPase
MKTQTERAAAFSLMGLGVAELVPAVYGGAWDRAALAGLAPLVLEAAEVAAVAAEVVAEGAGELARAAAAVARALGWQEFPLALAGGLLGEERYRLRVLAALAAEGLRPGPVTLVSEPAEGAVKRARKGDVWCP